MVRIVGAASLLAACSGQKPETDEENVDRQQQALHQDGDWTRAEGHVVGVMTRNAYIGADLTGVVAARDLTSFVAATGAILRQVNATNFPVRAEGLAAEIRGAHPDLVSLQEVALWRTGAPSLAPLLGGPKTALTVRYDFLETLLHQLNAGMERYRAVVIQDTLDVEAPADENGTRGDGPPPTVNAELNVRLTMRNVILERVDAGVHVWEPESALFQHQLTLPILGQPITFTRGYAKVEARVRGSGPFVFVSTQLQPYDPATGPTNVGALQAGELVARLGRGTSARPVVLAGDLNSDDDTVAPIEQAAYRRLLDGGFVERSTGNPLSCCINSYDLTTGNASQLEQQVDHIMTNEPRDVQLVVSFVTGRTMHDGYWDSDHAGIFSALRFR
jgi:endonuclease/exonuclease/phosphatase family metal-dependent hydrolase